jgi:DNA replication and repair protein RecF
MPLAHIELSGVRNLSALRLTAHSRLNIVVGPNASGKTSLLEAIHLLGTGKSFRTGRLEKVIQHGSDTLTVFGRCHRDGEEVALGYQRRDGEYEIHINGKKADQLAALAQQLPLQVVSPDTHFSFLKHARYRRSAVDWGLFHVEPEFYGLWTRYQRLLKQRNAALKQPGTPADVWDEQLAESGEQIHSARREYLDRVNSRIKRYGELLLAGEELGYRLRSGWRQDSSLATVLREDRGRDQDHGFTHSGPHRADLELVLSGYDARLEASQGQWKLLTLVLRLAQLEDFVEKTGRDCLLLLDDLAAELDPTRRAKVMELLASLPLQVFATATELSHLDTSAWTEQKVFHVERGDIVEQS